MITSEITSRICTTRDSDLKVVNAARVSFAKESTTIDEGDERLIRYLANHKHWTPFSHCRETFAFKMTEIDAIGFLTKHNQEDLASAVWDYNSEEQILTVRHSLYGWANIINKNWDNERYTFVYSALCFSYPISMKYLITDAAKSFHDAEYDLTKIFSYAAQVNKKFANDPHFKDITMIETVPIFVARQRFKHMIGTTYNEVSRRYVNTEPDLYFPEQWRGKAANKKQGSLETACEGMYAQTVDVANGYGVMESYDAIINRSFVDVIANYNHLVSDSVQLCPEQARMILPQSMMTEYYVTANVSAWNRFIHQRLDSHAQKEIQDLAALSQKLLSHHMLDGIEGTY